MSSLNDIDKIKKFALKMNKKYGYDIKSDGWFNFTRWHIDDIRSCLEEKNIKPTDENVKIFFREIYPDIQGTIAKVVMDLIEEVIAMNKEKFVKEEKK